MGDTPAGQAFTRAPGPVPGPVKVDGRPSRCRGISVEIERSPSLTPRVRQRYTAADAWLWECNTRSGLCDEKCLSPGGPSEAAPPVPIPNTAVKRLSADDTAPARTWENKSLPGGFALSGGEYSRIEAYHRLKHGASPPYPHPHPQRLARIAKGYNLSGEGLGKDHYVTMLTSV